MTLPVLPMLVWALAAAGPHPAGVPAASPAAQARGADEQASWRELVERDARVGFAPLTGGLALEALDLPELPAEQRAAALFALGSSGSLAKRDQLETWARRGAPAERRAAVLALGELGPGSTPLLLEIARQESGELAECALLALLRSGQRDAVAAVEELAADPASPWAEAAQALIAFQRDRASAPPSVGARAWLELRYASARRFGLIDGKTWRVLQYERLGADEAFLDGLVFSAVRRLRMPGVKDQLLMAVLEEPSERALRAGVDVIPTDLAQLAEVGLWTPRGDEWVVVLEEIEDSGVEGLCEPLLLQALAVEELQGWAAYLLVRGGNTRGKPVLESSLRDASAQTRRRVAEGLGASGDRSWLEWLESLDTDPDEEVRAAALLARARLGDLGAEATLDVLLYGEGAGRQDMRRELLIEGLARAGKDPLALDYLEDLLGLLVGRLRVTAAVALAAGGRPRGAEVLREQLQAGLARGPEGARLVRALGRAATASDIELMRGVFPVEDDVDMNIALAEVLLGAKSPAVVSLLRGAVWHPPMHRSLLASALVVQAGGVAELRRELENPPRTARAEDLRRVGFALGFWGGIKQVEDLSRQWSVGHPALQGTLLGALAARTL